MRKRDASRRGIAAVEFGLLLPLMVLLLFFLVEGASAMHAYSTLVEASREGARKALVDGDTANVAAMVEALTTDLDRDSLTTAVSEGPDTVTVEVSYDYHPFNENILEILVGSETIQLAARTTMPLP
ncbi:TadE/TadG family type IV pilus assembly protein [Pseudodesulfovibrio sp.]|uniref:TadE/TadG family type IV pilus assembly protein n=1 Tax=Pseudodesulfovibrio sp. TaxID=2035812 RepID=UPI0026199892|nr:TadE/TadG family type IV pilus assembly protein [Pseudodesulfovibrio sp.]MDD3311557.1 TadE/TadG family type IV pilus assembly protein [Pseudodesulfovibrio sp.]